MDPIMNVMLYLNQKVDELQWNFVQVNKVTRMYTPVNK